LQPSIGEALQLVASPATVARAELYALRQTPGVSFFEPPPAPERPPEPDVRERPWLHAPRNELGAVVPLRLVLGRTDLVAVALIGATAYTTGVELTLAVRWRPSADERDMYDDPFEPPFGHPRRRGAGELDPEVLRFGVQFSDGRKATTLGYSFPPLRDAEAEPSGPLLVPGGAGGGDGVWDSEFWLWPLPPPGTLTFAIEWPAKGIELTKHEVDAAPFVEASSLSEKLWPEEDPVGGSRLHVQQSVLRFEEDVENGG